MRAAALVGAALLPILTLTLLLPQASATGGAPTPGFWCLVCGHRGTADFLLNVVLFLPLGAALRAAGVRLTTVLLIGLALAGSIEAAQRWMPGRYSTLGDLAANSLGASVGALLLGPGSWSLRGPRSGRRQAVLTAIVATVWIGTAALFQPSLPEREYYAQWTAELGHYATYHGHVLEAAVGNQPAPSWRLRSSVQARRSLLSGDTLSVTALAAPPPEGVAPILSVYDDRQQEVLLLGADGEDLVLRVRRVAADLRLEAPELRWRGALAGVEPGDTLRLAAWRSSGAAFCVQARGDERCEKPTIERGWMLLLGPAAVPEAASFILDTLWMLALVGAALWWAPGYWAGSAGLVVLVLVAGLATAV